MKKHKVPQQSKRLCMPTEHTDNTAFISDDGDHEDQAVINLVLEDKKGEQLMEYHFQVTPQTVEERVKAMKDYLLEIAGIPPSEDTPLPNLECHQACFLLGGYRKH